MRIVLSLSNYINLTGSEIYNYELAKELSSRGYLVTILANQIGGEILKKTRRLKNVRILPFFEHENVVADLVISSQPLPTVYALRFFQDTQICHMQVLHSLFTYEEPIIDTAIKQYIAVRPEIHEHWATKQPLIAKKIKTIWNGFDTTRFNEKNTAHSKKLIRLFVGTADQLRRAAIQDLLNDAVQNPDSQLWLVLNENPFGKAKLPANVSIYDERWNTEGLIKSCSETAGIFVGRTTIEGFLCGKPGLVYDVDFQGNILKKATYGVPENREMFDIVYMTDRILETYNTHRYDI